MNRSELRKPFMRTTKDTGDRVHGSTPEARVRLLPGEVNAAGARLGESQPRPNIPGRQVGRACRGSKTRAPSVKLPGRNLSFLLWVLMSSTAFAAEPWTLERALEQALAHNPDTQLARYRITADQAGVDQANAAF